VVVVAYGAIAGDAAPVGFDSLAVEPIRSAAPDEELVSVEASGKEIRTRRGSPYVGTDARPQVEWRDHAALLGSDDGGGGSAPEKSRRRPVAAVVFVSLVLAAVTVALLSGSDEQAAGTRDEARADSSATSSVLPVDQPRVIATGKDPRGRTWVIEPRISDTGDVCTRLNVIGRGLSRELCEPRPQEKPFGRASFLGLRDEGELSYISWIVVSERTARVETLTGGGTERHVADIVTDSDVGVRCAVSYVNRLQPVKFVAFDASGQQIGEIDLGPVRAPTP
jgi:hypothetical protein